MWELLHGAYAVVEPHVDPAVAANRFLVLAEFLSLGYLLWVAKF